MRVPESDFTLLTVRTTRQGCSVIPVTFDSVYPWHDYSTAGN